MAKKTLLIVDGDPDIRESLSSLFNGIYSVLACNSGNEALKLIKSKKFSSMIFINSCPELENLLFWYQQIIAESLVKEEWLLLIQPELTDLYY